MTSKWLHCEQHGQRYLDGGVCVFCWNEKYQARQQPPKETQRQQIERWLADGETWVGVFENHDLGSHNVGDRIAIPFDIKQIELAHVGRMHAPELARKFGHIPWQMVLVTKCKTADEVEAALLPSTELVQRDS